MRDISLKQSTMKTQSVIALKILLVMTVLTGVVYPLTMTGILQLAFPGRSNGSMVYREGQIIGSELIGQKFDSSIYFWPRPSAIDYNPIPSSGSNLGPASNKLKAQVEQRRELLLKVHHIDHQSEIPIEMIVASASGLDPHISPEAALMQASRVASARNLNENQKDELLQLISDLSEKPQILIFGQPRINVFKLNLALDNIR